MSTAKHTPGPLVTRVASTGDVGIIATGQGAHGALANIGGALVAECYCDIRRPFENATVEALANATLFAAASDLLEGLQFAIRFHDQLTPSDVARMKAIVAKASGLEGRAA